MFIMSLLSRTINEVDKQSAKKKQTMYDLEKTIREMAKSKGMQPRNFLIKACEMSDKLAKNPVIKALIGEYDVPTQKGRDAKPKVLTKRAMNVVKKGIKQAANKQRRRIDKDSVGEDVKDQFTKLINPMGQDSTSLEKIKQSPGFHKLISTMFASGTQADMEWDEIFSAMSKMLNMNPIEIKAILQQDGFEFVEPDAETKFKQNMGGTGFLGKGKTRTVNSVYEGSLDQFRNLYKKSIGSDDAAVTLRELIQAINDDALWSDQFPQLKQFVAVSPLSGSKVVTAKKIPGNSYDEKLQALVQAIDDDQWVNDTAKHLMRSYSMDEGEQTFEDEAQDRGYAQMIIQQHQDEYKKFMDTGDLMDAPTIYEKLFAYFSSSDADDQMPYGTQKARDGDPYVWLVDKLDELGLIIEEGNEFAQKVRQLKATGAKKGTKFKTSDGQEHTLEDLYAQTIDFMAELEQKIKEQSVRESYNQEAEQKMTAKDAKLKALQDIQMDRHTDKDKELVRKLIQRKKELMQKESVTLEEMVNIPITEEEFEKLAEKKDACYHKVKSRYKVWPSAYASGALVQCRKKGAANWGNKS